MDINRSVKPYTIKTYKRLVILFFVMLFLVIVPCIIGYYMHEIMYDHINIRNTFAVIGGVVGLPTFLLLMEITNTSLSEGCNRLFIDSKPTT